MKLYLIFLLIFSLLHSSLGFFNTGLMDETNPQFKADASLWKITPTPCSTCSLTYQTDINSCYAQSDLVLGGPGILSPTSTDKILFQRTYKDLSPHVSVTFSINISYFRGSTAPPNAQPVINLLFDNEIISGPRISTADTCSASSPTLQLVTFQGAVTHNSPSLTIGIQALFSFEQIQVGFREVVLFLYKTTPTFSIAADSPVCQASAPPQTYAFNGCKCPLGQEYFGSSCKDCSFKCSTCFDFGDSCFTCTAGNFWTGSYCWPSLPCCQTYIGGICKTCSSGCFSYGNGVCQASCDPDVGYYPIQVLSALYCFQQCPDSSFPIRYLNGSCLSSCSFPLASGSTSVNGILIDYCYSPCSTYQYLNPDGSCSFGCSSPLTQITIGGIAYCQSPCSDLSQFDSTTLGSCIDSCPPPLQNRNVTGVLVCSNPCNGSDFLYSNGSCLSTCPEPLQTRSEPLATYCINPCSGDDYLYADGSCMNNCPLPFVIRQEPGVKYCLLLCNGYLTSDNICLSKCDPPLKKRIQKDTLIAYCDSPCSHSTDYYYPDHKSCHSQCKYPNQATKQNELLQTCTLMVTQDQVDQAKALAKTTETADSISSGGIIVGSLISSSDSTSAAMGALAKMLSYIKFMNINFPPKLQLLFNSQSSNSILLSSIPNSLRNRISNEPPPENFGKYNLSSSFLVNFWQSIFILGIISMVILILLAFSILLKRCTGVTGLIQKILPALKWNTFFTLFCSYSGDIVLFSALEFQTSQYVNFWSATSLTLCVLINTLMGYTLYKILLVNFSVRKTQQNKTTEEISEDFGDYKALFECYKEDSYFQQIFLFVFMIRMSLFNVIIGYLFPYPLTQAILIILLNGGVLAYLIIKRPMRKIINLIQQILLEGIIFVFNIGVIILAILDAKEQEAESAREKIGDMMIMINVIAPILSMVLIAIKIGLIVWELYKNYKKSKISAGQKLSDIVHIQQARANSALSQPKGTISHPKNQMVTLNQSSFITNQTNQNLLYPNYNTNNSTLFSDENMDTSFNLQTPQRNPEISSQSSTLNISSIEETSQDFPRNRNPHQQIENRNPRIKRTRGPRPRRFVDNMISFDPQINK